MQYRTDMSDDLVAAHAHFSSIREDPDVKPNATSLTGLPKTTVQPKGIAVFRLYYADRNMLTGNCLTAKKSPTKKAGRSVKDEVTGGSTGGGEFRATSKDMAYHYVMYALGKVTPETRREIAAKLGVRQKNLDAVSVVEDDTAMLHQTC